MILQSTPMLFVDKVGPSEAFFEKRGFARTMSVPTARKADPIAGRAQQAGIDDELAIGRHIGHR